MNASRRYLRHASRRAQRGFAMAYLVAILVLASLVTWVMFNMMDTNAEVRWINQQADLIQEQTSIIRKQVILCGTLYPSGVNSDATSLPHYRKYPATSPSLGAIVCPGAPLAEQLVWGGRDGVFLKRLPGDFTSWSYSNGSDGIKVSITSSTPRARAVLSKLISRIGSTEASLSGNTFSFLVAAP